MIHQFDFTLLNRATEIAQAQDWLEAIAASHSFPNRKLHEVQLALEEHLTNILQYGYDDERAHEIQIRVSLAEAEMSIQVKDDGRPFDPLTHAAPALTGPVAERPVGGLGIYLMRQSVDQVEYRREEGSNILVLIKRI
jgi:anti-sigma regulatory factor (Ser/Thr protein kinase)